MTPTKIFGFIMFFCLLASSFAMATTKPAAAKSTAKPAPVATSANSDYALAREEFAKGHTPTDAALQLGKFWNCAVYARKGGDPKLGGIKLVKTAQGIKDATNPAKDPNAPTYFKITSQGLVSTVTTASQTSHYAFRINGTNTLILEMSDSRAPDAKSGFLDASIVFPQAFVDNYYSCDDPSANPGVCDAGMHSVSADYCCPDGESLAGYHDCESSYGGGGQGGHSDECVSGSDLMGSGGFARICAGTWNGNCITGTNLYDSALGIAEICQ